MGAKALQNIPQPDFEIIIASGPESGARFKLKGSPILIGRGKQNHICLPKDPKISRQHAKIVFTQSSIEITDISGRKRMKVNGVQCEKALLINNAKIQIGDTLIIFQRSSENKSPELVHASKAVKAQKKNKTTQETHKKPNLLRKVLIYSVVFLLIYLVLSDPPQKNQNQVLLKTEEAAKKELQKNKILQEEIKKQIHKQGIDSPQFKEAQAAYIRGFRDFKNANFASAIQSFQACLSLFREHKLCQRYYRLAYRKHNEIIQYNMVLGQQYKEQGQYQKCAFRYKSVMTLVRDPNNKIYKEAKAAAQTCQLLIKDKY